MSGIFKLGSDAFDPMKILKGNVIPADACLATPFVMQENASLDAWASNPTCLQVLTNFGARYKKVASCEETGKVAQPFQAKSGREPTEKFFESVVAPVANYIVDISEYAQNWMAASWMFGQMPKRAFAGHAPNCAAMLRMLSYGEMEVYTFSTLDFLKALAGKGMRVPTNSSELEQAMGSKTPSLVS